MGKCLSCCEPTSPSCEPTFTSSHPPPPSSHTRAAPLVPPIHTKDVKQGSGDREIPALPPGKLPIPPSDKKMFGQYPKLPPILKPNNGDTKRLSVVSRECSDTKIQALFEQYKEPNEEAMLAEGIEKFCSDLEVKPDEFIVLVLAWKFQAETMCKFTREEFLSGCKTLKVDTIKGLQLKFPEMLKDVQNKQLFKDLYRWTYKFGLDADTGQKTLPIEMAIGLWKLVFSKNQPPILECWLEFLEKHPNIRGIPKDTWDMYLNFTEQVGDDLSTYDDTDAWPSLIDDFVEYQNDRQNQNV